MVTDKYVFSLKTATQTDRFVGVYNLLKTETCGDIC